MAELKKLGRYELHRVLGKGAMGVVYEGYDPTLGRRVAVKTILKTVAHDEETQRNYAERFVREAKAVARLNHPNIIQVFDFGVEDDVAFLVMEFIQGRELRSYFDAQEAFDAGEVVRIMGELLDALHFAHEAGVIHRDVNPANVMLDAQRHAKLADFGVARVQDSDRSAAGTMVGTPAFMSPEQISGGKVDRRTDIFSAGVILYQLLTGEQPFKGEGAWTVAKQIMQDDPPPPSSVVRSVSPVLDAIVDKALAKKPADRFANAREFAATLRATLHTGPQPASLAVQMPKRRPRPESGASDAEVEFWRSIQNSSDPHEFEIYLRKFPDGMYSELAQHKIAKLRDTKAADADSTVRLEAEAAAKRQQAEERARQEAREKARRDAEEKAQKEAAEKAKREAAERARRDAEEKARAEAAARAKREAEEKARREAEEKARREATERARREAEEKTKQEALENARREAEENARIEAAARAKREAEEKARREATERARREAEEKTKQEALENARREAEEKARIEAAARAKREAEEKARRETAEKVRQAQELARLKQQEEAAAKARVKAKAGMGEDATVAQPLSRQEVAPSPAKAKSIAIPAAFGALAIAGAIGAYLFAGRAPTPVAETPSVQSAAAPAPAVDAEKIRREAEERLRKELAEKATAERAAAERVTQAKTAAERAAAEKAVAAASAERLAAQKAAAEKAAANRAAEKADALRAAAEKAAMEKAAVEKALAERAAAEKAAAEKAAAEKAAAEKLAAEKAAAERATKEIAEREARLRDAEEVRKVERQNGLSTYFGVRIGDPVARLLEAAGQPMSIRSVGRFDAYTFRDPFTVTPYATFYVAKDSQKVYAIYIVSQPAAAEKAAAEKVAANSDEAKLERFIQRVGREKMMKQEPINLFAGQVVYINDGSCSRGWIREVSGTARQNSENPVRRNSRCIPLESAAEKPSAENPAAAEKAAAERLAAEKLAASSDDAKLERFIQRVGRDKVVKEEPPRIFGAMFHGQVLYANDGSCGPGRIKEVIGGPTGYPGGMVGGPRETRCIPLE